MPLVTNPCIPFDVSQRWRSDPLLLNETWPQTVLGRKGKRKSTIHTCARLSLNLTRLHSPLVSGRLKINKFHPSFSPSRIIRPLRDSILINKSRKMHGTLYVASLLVRSVEVRRSGVPSVWVSLYYSYTWVHSFSHLGALGSREGGLRFGR